MADRALYLLLIQGCEPSILGPFATEKERYDKAKEVWREDCDTAEVDNVFRLDAGPDGPKAWPFVNGELDEPEDISEGDYPEDWYG